MYAKDFIGIKEKRPEGWRPRPFPPRKNLRDGVRTLFPIMSEDQKDF